MPVNRTLITAWISPGRETGWLCPKCSAGQLNHIKGKFQSADDGVPVREIEIPALYFTAMMRCSNDECRLATCVSGTGFSDVVPDESSGHRIETLFQPKHVKPSPALISIPKECPGNARAELERAFTSAWGDPGAAGQHIRIAAEFMLDALSVQKHTPSGGFLTLEARINLLTGEHAASRESMLAVKCLGNAGSHTSGISQADVFDALDILEEVLDDFFVGYRKALRVKTAEIIAAKGPVRK